MTEHIDHVLIVDDHPIVLYGLRFLFDHHARFTICGEASDAETARHLAQQLQPNYIVLDLVLGGRDGIDLVKDLMAAAPAARILIYSSQNEWRFARRALQAGAKGYVAKSEGLVVVEHAISVLASGETFLSEGVQRRLIEDFLGVDEDQESAGFDLLSNRELQVLRMIGEGLSTGEIGRALQLSVKTIGTYRERIKEKLALTSARTLEELARSSVVES
ncbi:response regulator [Sphingomonas crusticola]|uniref:response regulator n=1 Tax=Sphingomonas crusticola TaxID=1697973 RepID=UPI0013C31D73|nr:response regulator transcription factor [Sphingomonas crusticola]